MENRSIFLISGLLCALGLMLTAVFNMHLLFAWFFSLLCIVIASKSYLLFSANNNVHYTLSKSSHFPLLFVLSKILKDSKMLSFQTRSSLIVFSGIVSFVLFLMLMTTFLSNIDSFLRLLASFMFAGVFSFVWVNRVLRSIQSVV